MTALLLLAVGTALAQSDDAPPDVPLWPGATATVRARDEAVLRGVEFVYALGMGRDDANFFAYGHDFLLCLHGVAHRAVGPVVHQRALDVAKALGRKWKREHTEVHEDATTAHAQRLLFGTFALDRLGMHFATLKAELREFLAAHDSHDFLGWHPAQRGPDEEAPPAPPPRRTRRTRKDGGELVESAAIDGAAANASSPLRRWAGALVRTYVADKLQLPLGGLTSPAATYADALRWRPTFLPYGAGGATGGAAARGARLRPLQPDVGARVGVGRRRRRRRAARRGARLWAERGGRARGGARRRRLPPPDAAARRLVARRHQGRRRAGGVPPDVRGDARPRAARAPRVWAGDAERAADAAAAGGARGGEG